MFTGLQKLTEHDDICIGSHKEAPGWAVPRPEGIQGIPPEHLQSRPKDQGLAYRLQLHGTQMSSYGYYMQGMMCDLEHVKSMELFKLRKWLQAL